MIATGNSHANRILQVNHAGEHGAVHIYAGQILVARLTAPAMLTELREFKAHEEKHRALFAAALQRRSCRPCHSVFLCAAGGFVLGAVTALFGRRAIAATTVAVERVVLRHLQSQISTLANQDAEAVEVITAIVAEEQMHHDQSATHLEKSSMCSKSLQAAVSGATEMVIWTGMRV
ncbi:demethoxyubiquinone hydroxylase family protein [Undibacterium pigrum]|uniref:Ubiquinone biosynthesis monooxygenase Coq7 n=1 Tax=Undibacterium pigrum TaxID=401470 RepID=A0A318J2S2_9BURK|nr:demethoxyubiquinone hydroxylase family protein [Undibacterium pigrum]PXX41433.1 ubiquinone biosynthesis monooxygenase Coq7 [Undibacterium pigrum]